MKNSPSNHNANDGYEEGLFDFLLSGEKIDPGKRSNIDIDTPNNRKKSYFTDYKTFCDCVDAKPKHVDLDRFVDLKNHNPSKIFANLVSASDATSPIAFLSSPNNNSAKKDRSEAFRAHELMRKGYENYYKGNYYEACIAYRDALHIREFQGSTSSNIADSYSNLGICYHKLGFIEDAITCHNKALDMRMTLNNSAESDPKVADSYGNLGAAFLDVNDLDLAQKCFANAVYIRKIICKGDLYSNNILTSYHQFGSLALAKGDYDFAKIFFKTALYINKIIHQNDPYNSSTVTSLSNLGVMGLKTGEIEFAEKCFSNALTILLKIHGDSACHPCIAYTYSSLGSISLQQKKYDEGLSYLNTALQMYQKSFEGNPYHIEIAYSLYNISLGHFLQNNYLESSKSLVEVFGIASKIDSPDLSQKIIFLNDQLMHQIEPGKFQKFFLESNDAQTTNYQYDPDICFISKSSYQAETDELLKSAQEILNQAMLDAREGIDQINTNILESSIIGDHL